MMLWSLAGGKGERIKEREVVSVSGGFGSWYSGLVACG